MSSTPSNPQLNLMRLSLIPYSALFSGPCNMEMSAMGHNVHPACCVMHVKLQDCLIMPQHNMTRDCHLRCVHAAAIQGSSDRRNNRDRSHACF